MAEKIFPTMRMEELFAVEAMQGILYRDSRLTTRPMTWYEESPAGVQGLFDGIAYSKCKCRYFLKFLRKISLKNYLKHL
jgi:hypothetical protein